MLEINIKQLNNDEGNNSNKIYSHTMRSRLLSNYRLIVGPRKIVVLKTNICGLGQHFQDLGISVNIKRWMVFKKKSHDRKHVG